MMSPLMFGHTLRILRTAAGISLRSLAKKTEVSPAYLSQVELGKLPPPTYDRLAKIAETIGIPMALLMEMSHRPNPEAILLLRGHQELNELIKVVVDSGLEMRDVSEMISLMKHLGDRGMRKLIRYAEDHLCDFSGAESNLRSHDVSFFPEKQTAIGDMANPRLVFEKLDFKDKRELLKFMVEKTGRICGTLDPDRAYKELISNETEDSSGIGNGAAIPHLFLDELDRTLIAIARVPEGIEFDAIDEKPVYLVCLILSGPDSQENHLNLLAHFARKFQNPAFMHDILRADSKKSMIEMLFNRDNTKIH
jgi:PTS system nitrogen regulatory IIA component